MCSDIASQIRAIVSKKKKRYQKQGFDLDLTYVTDRIIAMGFPADKFEALYRNSIDDVARFLELNHGSKYKIYNLCRERSFDASKFTGEIGRFPFDDHNPPAFTILTECIKDIGEFLTRNPDNVVAINCKAGKGRTGVIVCCSMLHLKLSKDATTALTEYGHSRTYNGKGVTIPSQIRYIYYYDYFYRNNLTYKPTALWLRLVKFDVVPNINHSELQFAIYQFDSLTKLHLSKTYKISKYNRVVLFHEMLTFPVYNDLRFEFMEKSVLGRSIPLCHCWLNTFFVVHQPPIQKFELESKGSEQKGCFKSPDNSKLNLNKDAMISSESNPNLTDNPANREIMYKVSLTKQEIDKANKDVNCKVFPADFEISFLFSDTPPNLICRQRNGSSIIKSENSTFFETFIGRSTESMIPQLEAIWKSSSSQFYFMCD